MSRSLRFDWFARAARPKVVLPHRRALRMEPLEDRRLLAALVGVDFGLGLAPANWAQISGVGSTAFPTTRTNLTDDAGAATPVDLTISTTYSGNAFSAVAAINGATLPQHTPSVFNVSNIVYVDGTHGVHRFDAAWSDLKPASVYEVYVFGLDSAADATPVINNQTVTISGSGSPIAFGQNSSSGNLWVNDQVGSSAQQLENYHKLISPTAAGRIDVTIAKTAGSHSLVLAGLAIREVGILVNSTADGDDMNAADGVTTLREAIRLANTSAGADTILFADNLSGQTIMLGGSELVITEALTIDAAPLTQNVTINAQLQSRIFNITAATGDFTLIGLTLNSGRTTSNNGFGETTHNGGAIHAVTVGLLTVRECSISGNGTMGANANGGGIFAAGPLSIIQSSISGNTTLNGNAGRGGGIAATTVALTQSSVSLNTADLGGGIYASTVTMTQSTLSANTTSSSGGGIWASGDVTLLQSTVSGNSSNISGGGIFNQGAVTLTQSTISGNIASFGSGGGILTSRAVTLTQSTVSGNHAMAGAGGGIYQFDGASNHPLSITGSIIAGNSGSVGSPDLRPDSQSVVVPNSVTYTLIGNTSGSGVSGGTGNLLNVAAFLGPLADNGGLTKTHALLRGSPAIDAGDPAINSGVDQRGFPRVVDGDTVSGARIDIGAYESAFIALEVDTNSDVADGIYTVGQLSLREAILLANARPGAETITFAAGVSGEITLGSQLPTITQALTITGPGANLLTINAGNGTDGVFGNGDGWRIFDVDDGTAGLITATISGLTLTGGDVSAGGAIRNTENLTVRDSWIVANSGNFGGGIVNSGTLTVERSTLSGNKAASGGGGINSSGTTTIRNSTISGNDAPGASGGGIINYAPPAGLASLTVENSTITNNTASSAAALRSFGVGSIVAALHNSIVNGTVVNTGALTGNYNLFSLSNPGITGSNNQFSANASLGALANNGGPTMTHALPAGSPAIDAGDPVIASGFDQRGTGFNRVVDGDAVVGARIDIGAYELQISSSASAGDYNQDDTVNIADYVLWRDTLGQTGIGLPANGDNTGASENKIDQADHTVWCNNFGTTLSSPGSGTGATGSASAESESASTSSTFALTAFTPSSSRQSSSVALNHTSNAPNDKRMLLAFDQALEELDEERTESRWLADADDGEDETESEYALAAALSDWQ